MIMIQMCAACRNKRFKLHRYRRVSGIQRRWLRSSRAYLTKYKEYVSNTTPVRARSSPNWKVPNVSPIGSVGVAPNQKQASTRKLKGRQVQKLACLGGRWGNLNLELNWKDIVKMRSFQAVMRGPCTFSYSKTLLLRTRPRRHVVSFGTKQRFFERAQT